MKKTLFLVICIALCLCLFAACGKGETTVEPSDGESADVVDTSAAFDDTTKTPGVTDLVFGDPVTDDAHRWTLISFVTSESEIPCAGVYVCEDCKEQKTKSIHYTDIDIPLVYVSGDLTGISKENKVRSEITYAYKNQVISCAATLKWQGDGSLAHPKKNYSVAFYDEAFDKKKKVEIKQEWGAQSKYCLKANYSDPTGARNLVLSDLYGMAARTASGTDEYSELLNGGAVDGFPVLLYMNGQYAGLYNWNIPKDKWLFGMGDETAGEAVLCGDALLLDEGSGITVDEEIKGHWEIEYCNAKFTEEGGTDWAVRSFNEMLAFVQSSDKATLRAHASEYLNVDRTLDVILFSCVLGGSDTIVKNMLWTTYDGKRWAPNLYDLDRTFGRDGVQLESPNGFEDFKGQPLYGKLFIAFFDELKERYAALRRTILNTDTVMSLFSTVMEGLDDRYFRSEAERWPNAVWRETTDEVPIGSFADELKFIRTYTEKRLTYCDEIFSRTDLTYGESGYLDWGEEKK